MNAHLQPPLLELLRKGVAVPHPESVFVGDDVDPIRIADDCTIHPGCRLTGRDLSIGPRCALGDEGPLNLQNCQLGADVRLSGGHAADSTFLDGACVGSSAHIRPGTLLEEAARVAHAAGLKQTILFPRVVTGSLINFCDCLMAGGTGRGVHSEVGSSYIHFNFTPRGDKATASLFGDVPRGVLLDRPPIFLGGQGGAVGPLRVDFGVFVPAGIILRHDLMAGEPLRAPAPEPAPVPAFPFEEYRSLDRVIRNSLIYAGNILALREWYKNVRRLFMQDAPHSLACMCGALLRLDAIWEERISRLQELAGKAGNSAELLFRRGSDFAASASAQKRFADSWPELQERLYALQEHNPGSRERDALLETLADLPKNSYLEAIAALPAAARKAASAWLESIVAETASTWPRA